MDVKKGDTANLWGRREPELQKPDWFTSLVQAQKLLRFQGSIVKAEARHLIQERNLV